jgi:hypothetical protein
MAATGVGTIAAAIPCHDGGNWKLKLQQSLQQPPTPSPHHHFTGKIHRMYDKLLQFHARLGVSV